MSLGICVAGATGSTGSRVARIAADAGHEVVLAGRDEIRLRTLADKLHAADVIVFDLAASDSVEVALATADVVVNCVGPFARFGLPVARAAITTRTPYVDTCGEPRFCSALLGESATAKSPLVTAVGGSSLLADFATAIAIRGAPNPKRIGLSYRIAGMRPSRGSLASEVSMLADGAPVIRGGELALLPAGGAPVRLAEGRGVRFPVPDAMVISRYCKAQEADVYLVTPFPALVGAALRTAAIAFSWPLARSWLDRMAGAAPSFDDGRPHGRFAVTANVDGTRVTAQASDVYGFTAAAAVHIAESCARTTVAGLQAPSQVVGNIEATARHLGIEIVTSAAGTEPVSTKEPPSERL